MMPRALQLLYSETRGLERAAYVLAVSSLLSSVLALLRDRLLAEVFGAATTLDLYYAAFRIPDFLFVGTGALVSVYILIPELSRRAPEAQKRYIDTVIAGFSIVTVLLAILAGIFAPYILAQLFPQFALQGTLPVVIMLTRILLLQPFLLGLSNILAALTQMRHRYTLYSLSPILYNVGIIFGVLWLYPIWGIPGLAWGVVIGALLHFGVQVPSLVADGFLTRIPSIREPRALLTTGAVSVPRALALSMSQLSFLGLTALASALTPGSIAVFMFAFNLQSVPLSVIGASYSVAAFPTLAAALSRGERAEFITNVAAAARHVLFWSIPASALVLMLRAHLVRVILGAGAFDWNDTRLTAAAFAVLCLSLAAQGITLLLVRGYYAAGRTFVPFIVTAGTTVLTLALAAIFINGLENQSFLAATENILRVQNIPGSNVLALAIAYAISAILNAAILVVLFERRFGGFIEQIRRAFFESMLAAMGAAVAAYALLSALGPLTIASETLSVFLRGFAGGVFGIIVAGLIYYVLGSREYAETIDALWGRIRKGTAVVTVVSSAEDVSPSHTL